MAKRMLVLGFLLIGAIGFIVGIGSPDWYHIHGNTSTKHPTLGVYRQCDDYPDGCDTIDTKKLANCANGDYNGDLDLAGYGKDNCQKHITAQAFTMMALLLSALSVILFIALRSRYKLASGLSLCASIIGMIGLVVFINIKYPTITGGHITISDAVKDKSLDWGWGFILFVLGIISSGLGGILGALFGKA